MIETFFRALNRRVIPLVQSGLANPLPLGVGLVVAETTGRVSGKQRRVPLVSTRICNTVTVSTFRHDSQWLRNLETDPKVSVFINGNQRRGTAEIDRGILNVVRITLDPRDPLR
ncbi:MAG: nitroreductase family deazaflavin-dependent oxidoreductase [Acidobacteria bacterium]|nr:nitroreductase family deazaflavin-dependent oxidoreductase [Acidobacteriota bacterium]